MKKTVFLDIENTITMSLQKLNDSTLNLIKNLEDDYNFCVCTSAFEVDCKNFLEMNNLSWNYICNAGAYVHYNNLTYVKYFTLPLKILLPFDYDIKFLFYEKNNVLYIYKYDKMLEFLYPKNQNRYYINNLLEITNPNFLQVYIAINQGVREQFIELLERKNIRVNIIGEDSKLIIFRLTHKDVTKGYFIKTILYKNKIDFNDTISFGDSLDDIYLLKETNLKIAVKNSDDLLQQFSTDICDDYNNDGVFKYLENLKAKN